MNERDHIASYLCRTDSAALTRVPSVERTNLRVALENRLVNSAVGLSS